MVRKTGAKGKSRSGAAVRSSKTRSSRLPRQRSQTEPPEKPETIFAKVFFSYWSAIQAQQAATLARTQQLYTDFMKKLGESCSQKGARAAFAEASRSFAAALRRTAEQDGDPEAMETAYRDFVEGLRDAWTEPEVLQPLEEASLAFSEQMQRANEDSQQALEAARKVYLEQLHSAWSHVDPDTLSEQTLTEVSGNMMVTVLFTEGMRPAEDSGALLF